MTDFAARVLRPEANDLPVRSRLDVDFYKPTMGAYIHRHHKGVRVRFVLINRDLGIPLARIVDESELRAALDHMTTLPVRRTDTYYMAGMDVWGANMFDRSFLDAFAKSMLPSYQLTRVGDQFELIFEGEWGEVTFWETIAMAIIMELYYRGLMRRMPKSEVGLLYGAMANKLHRKLKRLKTRPGIRISDFGQRRRHSFLWQKQAVEMAVDILGGQFTGTSNTWMAFHHDLVPIGTNAHELPMVLTALRMLAARKGGLDPNSPEYAETVRSAQYDVLREWSGMYGKGLRIVLPDTYGSEQFFAGMPEDLADDVAREWRGIRQDSGDPVKECEDFISWLKGRGLDDAEIAGKTCIFSDGLDVKLDGYGPVSDDPDILELYDRFEGRISTPFGWGTNLTNDPKGCLPDPDGIVPGLEDLGLDWKRVFKGFSLVCKVGGVSDGADWISAVKLSNNFNKATGPKDMVEEYRRIFGKAGAVSQAVTV